MSEREWTQEEIDADYFRDDDDYEDDLTDEDIAGEECGRWRNGRKDHYCTKAGSEECDWVCPYNGIRRTTPQKGT